MQRNDRTDGEYVCEVCDNSFTSAEARNDHLAEIGLLN